MTYFEDLSRYTYSNAVPEGISIKNVGWLAINREFPKAHASVNLLDVLWDYCSVIVTPTRGLHSCEFCVSPAHTFVRHGTRLLLGSGEIRIFSLGGDIFSAPNLIYHYIHDHQYRPPAEFVQAIEGGPHPTSDEYKRLMDLLAVKWRPNPPMAEEPRQFRVVQTEDGIVREEVKRRS